MRQLSPNLRRALEEPRSQEYVVVLLRIEHETIANPILVANDVINYVYNGETYFGFPFEIELVGDGAQVPRGQLRIQNVDRQIGEAVLNLTTPPRLSILLFAQSDFAEAQAVGDGVYEDTRFENEGITPEYEANHLIFGSISVNAMDVTGEIVSFDMSNEPWPALRSTADRLPGLEP